MDQLIREIEVPRCTGLPDSHHPVEIALGADGTGQISADEQECPHTGDEHGDAQQGVAECGEHLGLEAFFFGPPANDQEKKAEQ